MGLYFVAETDPFVHELFQSLNAKSYLQSESVAEVAALPSSTSQPVHTSPVVSIVNIALACRIGNKLCLILRCILLTAPY